MSNHYQDTTAPYVFELWNVPTSFNKSDIACVIQGSIMFFFNLHVFWGEDDAGKLLRDMVTIVIVFLFTYSRNLGHENLYIS